MVWLALSDEIVTSRWGAGWEEEEGHVSVRGG